MIPIQAKAARKGLIAIEIRIVSGRRIVTMTAIRIAIVTETATGPAAAEVDGVLPTKMRRSACATSLLFSVLLGLPMTAQAQPIDPHALFEEKCGRCHEHAGTFAREKLTIDNGEVVDLRSGKPILKTLASHFGKLSDAEAGMIVEMFRRQIMSGGHYERHCRFCHDPAKDLARQTLIMRNGRLIGRYTGQSIEDLLSYHGRLESDEQTVMLDMLTWQLTSIATE